MESHHIPTRSCASKGHCQDVYTRLGQSKGPSVTWSVLVAFGVPIAVFVAALLGFELATRNLIDRGGLRMATGFVVGLVLTALTVLAIKVITRRPVDDNA